MNAVGRNKAIQVAGMPMKFGFPLALVALLPGIAFAEEPCTSCWTAHFESSPAGAIVTADYDATSNLPASRCVTPCTLSVPPNSGVQFSAKLEGYRVAPGGPRVYWKNGRLMPDPLTIMFEPIPEALRNIAVPS
ncbi:MAG: hypothetical protein JF615_10430, partial [Asticcacaulis sp.]|nr:hypothetical protein [Asticcacaulis sp.]